MIRLLFLLHRYLGIAVGVLMVMWCLSGVVMMYVSYPALGETDRRAHLAPLSLTGCCRWSQVLADQLSSAGLRLEMLAGQPVALLHDPAGSYQTIDLRTGIALEQVSEQQAADVASAYAPNAAYPPHLMGKIHYDQWTLEDRSDDVPLYRFRLADQEQTDLYVSALTGQAVQTSTARERFWTWLGAIPHWLYFTEIRQRAQLWTQVIIYSSLIGCFLTATGLYLGVRQWLRRPTARWSPYRGFNFWHHIAGLLFGVLALTWVLSGLLSMNPWGWLEGHGAGKERSQIAGSALDPQVLIAALSEVAPQLPTDTTVLESAPFAGKPYFIATRADGTRERFDGRGASAPLSSADLPFIASALGLAGSNSAVLLDTEDRYYFSHHHQFVRLPAYRFISPAGTYYYVDPLSGVLLMKVDRGAQEYRWWHEALHRWDFSALLRQRPAWDVVMLLLMSGVTTVCVTGAYIGYRRLMR